jgi:hypothetical protein
MSKPEFQLANDPPQPKPRELENGASAQRMLLAGLDCLPGQHDLFQTDGEEDSEGET